MAYLIRIGTIEENKSRYGQRGYHCFRRGRTVVRRWAAVVIPSRRKIYWAFDFAEAVYYYSTEDDARADLQTLIKSLERKDYKRLPAGKKILPPQRKQAKHLKQ